MGVGRVTVGGPAFPGPTEFAHMRTRRVFGFALVVLLAAACAHAAPGAPTGFEAPPVGDESLEVHFMDVGQGDGMLIRTPDGKNYLLDTGTAGARRQIFPYFEKLGIERLDGIIISHSHADHAGGLYHFAGKFEVDALYSSGFFHATGRNSKALKRLVDLKVEHKKLRRGDTVELGGGVVLKVLHPPTHWKARPAQLNDFSLILRLSYGEIDFLMTGDAEKAAENAVLKAELELKSEFLKVGHHGSHTSSTPRFLDAVAPIYAVISCGRNNQFSHPHEPTINKLTKDRNIKVYRTDEQGTIVVRTNGKEFEIRTLGVPEARNAPPRTGRHFWRAQPGKPSSLVFAQGAAVPQR